MITPAELIALADAADEFYRECPNTIRWHRPMRCVDACREAAEALAAAEAKAKELKDILIIICDRQGINRALSGGRP